MAYKSQSETNRLLSDANNLISKAEIQTETERKICLHPCSKHEVCNYLLCVNAEYCNKCGMTKIEHKNWNSYRTLSVCMKVHARIKERLQSMVK